MQTDRVEGCTPQSVVGDRLQQRGTLMVGLAVATCFESKDYGEDGGSTSVGLKYSTLPITLCVDNVS